MSTQPSPRLTPEEYLAAERKAEFKSEYYAGQVFAMSGASHRHTLIVLNVGGELRSRLRATDCTVSSSDLRVRTGPEGLYTYPDVVVVYGRAKYVDEHPDTLVNPTVIFEVLSPTTQNYDRGQKFEFYRAIESLAEYVIVAQDRPHVEHYSRQADGSWLLRETNDPGATVQLSSVACELPLSEIYLKVDFTPQDSAPLSPTA